MTNFDLQYYWNPIEDRALIFATILLICNGVYGMKYIGPSHFVQLTVRGLKRAEFIYIFLNIRFFDEDIQKNVI